MWAKIRAKLREWFIVAIGVCLIAGGFFLASHQPSPSAAAFTAQDGKSPKAETAMQARQPAPPAAAKTVEQSHSSAATVITANIGQPVAKPSPGESHDHAMNQGMAAAAQTSTPPPANASGGDTGAGRLVFRKCQACHSLEPGKNILGPSLAGIIGRKAGSEPGYNYSPAMKQANFVWDAKTLDAYLSDPQKVVPGNKMPFPGLKTDHDRADVIAYLTPHRPAHPRRPALNRRLQQSNTRLHLHNKHRKARPAPTVGTFWMPNTRCDPALQRDEWSISASAARSTAK